MQQSCQPAGMKDVIKVTQRGRISIWTMNIPAKLNCLNFAMLTRLKELFESATSNTLVDAVVLTGTGRYFSSGAAFGDVGLTPTLRLSALHEQVANLNIGIFHPFIHFPKPLFVAVNGPAVGGATTLQLLCDAVICVPTATFHTPFKQLGITPEGCSTLTFKRKMGSEGARRMLDEGEKLGASEAVKLGFVDLMVRHDEDLVGAACDFAQQWLADGKGRLIVEQGLVEELDRVNHREGRQLADAMFSVEFMRAKGLPAAVAWPLSPILRLVAKL